MSETTASTQKKTTIADGDAPTLARATPRKLRNLLSWLWILPCMFVAQWPWRVQMWLGRRLGWLLHRLMTRRRHIAATNIALCFPERDKEGHDDLVRAHFQALGMGLFEFMRAWWGRIGKLAPSFKLEGAEHIERLQAEGRPILLISGHFTCFEIAGRLLSEQHPVAAMYRPHDSAALDYAVHRGRQHYTPALFTRDALRPALRFLKQGGMLWYAPDQDMRGKETLFAPFFGVPANTITATAQMARLTKAAVVPFGLCREGRGYVVRIGEPLQHFPSGDALADATAVNAMIEQLVLQAPEQYLWIHRRFKRRPNGQPSPYFS